jgi:hypothetical protein
MGSITIFIIKKNFFDMALGNLVFGIKFLETFLLKKFPGILPLHPLFLVEFLSLYPLCITIMSTFISFYCKRIVRFLTYFAALNEFSKNSQTKKAFTLVFFMKSIYLFAVKMYENRILHSFTNVNTRYHWDSNTS